MTLHDAYDASLYFFGHIARERYMGEEIGGRVISVIRVIDECEKGRCTEQTDRPRVGLRDRVDVLLELRRSCIDLLHSLHGYCTEYAGPPIRALPINGLRDSLTDYESAAWPENHHDRASKTVVALGFATRRTTPELSL
jgi:hypothetical protein